MASTMNPTMPSMPGSYLFQYDHNQCSGRSHNIFQPPAPSPTPTRRSSQIPRPVSRASSHASSRKRPRLDTSNSYFSRPARPAPSTRSSTTTPFSPDGSYDYVTYSNIESSTYSLDSQVPASPAPLAYSNYQLAGGLDTPSASIERSLEEIAQDEAERDYRINRYNTANTSRTTVSMYGSETTDKVRTPEFALSRNNSRKRIRSDLSPVKISESLTGWGLRSTAWALTGGLAGKVFHFCINTAFGGFRAGGGDSYRMNDDLGGFVEDYMNSPESRTATWYREATPTANHSQWGMSSSNDMSAIKNDWQIVDQVNFVESGDEQSPVRKRSRASVAGTWNRPSSRNSTDERSTPTTGASYASPRARSSTPRSYHHQRTASNGLFQPIRRARPSIASPRRSNSYIPAPSTTARGQKSPERPSSSASARQQNQTGKHNQAASSSLSPEAISYKRKMKAREKSEDESIMRLDAQLRDLIREGREALGSKVEILDGYNTTGDTDLDDGYSGSGWR